MRAASCDSDEWVDGVVCAARTGKYRVEIPSTGERIVRRPPEIRKKMASVTPHTEALSTVSAAKAKSAAEAVAETQKQLEQEETETAAAAAAAAARVKLEHDGQKRPEADEAQRAAAETAEAESAAAAADALQSQQESQSVAATAASNSSNPPPNSAAVIPSGAAARDESRTVPMQDGTAMSASASSSAAPPAPPLLSSEELSAHVSSLSDMSVQLSLLQSAVGSHASALSPLSAEHARQQAQLAALRVILGCTSAREYYLHVRLLLTCAHTGAAAIRGGNVESSGSSAAAAGKMAVEQLPKLIAKGLGKAAESIPLLGAGASVLTALISAADARSLNIQLQRLVRLAHTPAELSALVDTLASKLTLLQWPTLSSATELQRTVAGSGFRAWATKLLGPLKADAMYVVKGEQYLSDGEKCALADVEKIVAAVAEGKVHCECPPHVVGEEERAEWLALHILRHILPGRESYEEELPTTAVAAASASASAAAAAQSPSPSAVCSPSPSALVSPSAVVSASLSVSVASSVLLSPPLPASQLSPDSMALLMAEMAAMRAREAEREAARLEQLAAHAAELAQMKADADAQKAAAAKQEKALATQAALIKKLQEQQKPDAVDAGDGLAFASATADPTARRSARSPAEQQEANQRSLAQMQQQISELTSLVTQLHMRAEEEDGEGRQRAGSAARREAEARKELTQLKQQFQRKQSIQHEGHEEAQDGGDEDDVGV
jgi:hypothetical protein